MKRALIVMATIVAMIVIIAAGMPTAVLRISPSGFTQVHILAPALFAHRSSRNVKGVDPSIQFSI
jgi:hypothetical protein